MREYKISKYCLPFKARDKGHYVYLSRDNSLYTVSKDTFEKISRVREKPGEISDLPKSLLGELIENKILTTDDDEKEFYMQMQMDYLLESFSSNKLILTIAPTSQCNFDCPYCFEENKPTVRMSDQVISNLISFIRNFRNIEYLYLTWYGGEPLLAIELIATILERIHSEIPQVKIAYHFLVTNGYLVNDKVVQVFKKFPLNEIQITLDGSRERHNLLRRLKGTEKGTYDKIIRNIGKLLELMPKTQVSIRVNIDRDNADDYILVKDYLMNIFNGDPTLFVYPGILRIEDKERKCMGCPSLSHADIQSFYFQINDQVNFYPRIISKGCSATHINSFLIGPKGELYKCWNELGDSDKIIGFIDQKDLDNKRLVRDYVLASSCFQDEVCKECEILPICSGGCAYYRIKNKFEGGRFDVCSLYKGKGVLERCLIEHLHQAEEKEYEG